ncbi:hypothetical protein NEDG_01535 [Nematocida displodere]|uniref:Uncharacterized protein n=1 Tax=Nematocida displodere TaxID=1805483 RepID=A0A177EDU4_9MICR|nr:hypothetical protein NEDG_01535 [Nematocida displodere]
MEPVSVPSFVIRRMLKQNDLSPLNQIKAVTVIGKVVRRTGRLSIIFDSFCALPVYTNNPKLQEDIDRSIKESYLVGLHCQVEHYPRGHLSVEGIYRASFQEEMYKTLESMEFWKKILSQKQPK